MVDDTPENIQFIGGLLQRDYRVRVANNGAGALRVAAAQPHPDLILLDIMMPEMDGYEVLRRLRVAPETAEIPVIFVTAMDDVADEALGLSLGAVDYITKPVAPALLLARVRTQLDLKDARDWLKDRNAVLTAEVERRTADLRAAKLASEAANRSKSIFIDTMSHELRTPMTGIIGMLDLTKTEVPADSPVQEYLGMALESARSMSDLLTEILEYSSIANGEVALSRGPTDIAALLESLATRWRGAAEKNSLGFILSLDPALARDVICDGSRLSRALSILLDNALKFTRCGEIELGGNAGSPGLHLWVRDTGIGIAESDQARIFQPFEQIDGSMKRRYGGAGLGLAIAHRLIDLMGGTLWLESVPGHGATFHIGLGL
ncbi:MAG: ATP-binding protein [Rhodospirillaceae bacterium]